MQTAHPIVAGATSITGCNLKSIRVSFWPPDAADRVSPQLAEMWLQVADTGSDWTSPSCTPKQFSGGVVIDCSAALCFTGFRMQLTGPATYDAINWHLEGKTTDVEPTYFTVSSGSDLSAATKSTMSGTTLSTYATYAVSFCSADQMCNKGVTDAKYWLPITTPTYAEWNLMADLQLTNFPYKECTGMEMRSALASFLMVDQDSLAIKSISQEAFGAAWTLKVKVLIWVLADIPKTPGNGERTFDEQTQDALQKSADFGYGYVSFESNRIKQLFAASEASGEWSALMEAFRRIMPPGKLQPNQPSLLLSFTLAKDYTRRDVKRPRPSVKMEIDPLAGSEVSIPEPGNKWEPVYRVHSTVSVTMANEQDAATFANQEGQEAVQKGIAKFLMKEPNDMSIKGVESLNAMLPTGFVDRRLEISSVVLFKFFVPTSFTADAVSVARTLSNESEHGEPSIDIKTAIAEYAKSFGFGPLAADVVRDSTSVEIYVPKLAEGSDWGTDSSSWWNDWLIGLVIALLVVLLCIACCCIWGHFQARRRKKTRAVGKEFVEEEEFQEVRTRGVVLQHREKPVQHLEPHLLERMAHQPERVSMAVAPTTTTNVVTYSAPPQYYQQYAPLSTAPSTVVTRDSMQIQTMPVQGSTMYITRET